MNILNSAGVFVLIILWSGAIAQDNNETQKMREVSAFTSNLQNFGVAYRAGKLNRMWSIEAGNISFNQSINENNGDFSNQNIAGRLLIGREHRSVIKNKFSLRSGMGAILAVSNSIAEREFANGFSKAIDRNEVTSYTGGIYGMIGCIYQLDNGFNIGASLRPTITYNQSVQKTTNETSLNGTLIASNTNRSQAESVNFNFVSSTLQLNIGYRWSK